MTKDDVPNGILLILAAFTIAGGLFLGYLMARQANAPTDTSTQTQDGFERKNLHLKSSKDSKAENQVCIQVITHAVNPDTGENRFFANPCEVPAGWEILRE